MTEAERERAVSYLRETRTQVADQTAGMTEAQWRFKPSPAAWCAAECIEHLSITEQAMVDTIRALAKGPEPPAEVLAETAGKDDLLVRMVRSRKRRVQAPREAHPSATSPDPAELLTGFFRVREDAIRYLENTSDPLRRRVHPHFILGPFDGYQWMLFLGAHTERHLQQIQEAKEHPEFPR